MDETVAQIRRAMMSLGGLSLGDAFGGTYFGSHAERMIFGRQTMPPPWQYSDDTMMAMSIVEILREVGRIDQDALAARFARRFVEQPNRGYGGGATQLLRHIAGGGDWRAAAGIMFGGAGSMGNGAAMRAGPLGAYFADNLDVVVREAKASAAVTHAHADGQAGAVAVAVAAAVFCRTSDVQSEDSLRTTLFQEVLARVDAGLTREGIERAAALSADCAPQIAAAQLGNGSRVLSSDTVPFCLWCAGRTPRDFVRAMWTTVAGLGDRDTTCAIVGSIVASGREGLPETWLECREKLPREFGAS